MKNTNTRIIKMKANPWIPKSDKEAMLARLGLTQRSHVGRKKLLWTHF